MKTKFSAALLAIAALVPHLPASGAPADSLVHEGIVAASTDAVWDAFATAQGQESWLVSRAEIELRIGGRMRTHYDPKGVLGDANTIENTIISFEPRRMLSLQVSKAPENFPFPSEIKSMWTVVYFEPVGPDATRVRIVGLGFGDDERSQRLRQFFDRGNAFTLRKLQERFGAARVVE